MCAACLCVKRVAYPMLLLLPLPATALCADVRRQFVNAQDMDGCLDATFRTHLVVLAGSATAQTDRPTDRTTEVFILCLRQTTRQTRLSWTDCTFVLFCLGSHFATRYLCARSYSSMYLSTTGKFCCRNCHKPT